jgi:hypothetical protein
MGMMGLTSWELVHTKLGSFGNKYFSIGEEIRRTLLNL